MWGRIAAVNRDNNGPRGNRRDGAALPELVHALLWANVVQLIGSDMASKYQRAGSNNDSQPGWSAAGDVRGTPGPSPRPEPRAGLSSETQAAERPRADAADEEDRELAELLSALNRQIAATDALINKSGMLVKSIDAHWGGSPPQRRPPNFNNMPGSLPDNKRGRSEPPPPTPPPHSSSAPHGPMPSKSPGKP